MNLHIMPDEKFIDGFIDLVEQTPHAGNNKYVINSSGGLRYVKNRVLSAPYGSQEFNDLVGDLSRYERTWLHYLTNDMCKFINRMDGRAKIFWVFWGGDLYEKIDYPLYGSETIEFCKNNTIFSARRFSPRSIFSSWLIKRQIESAIQKISFILHFDPAEYQLVLKHFRTRAKYQFFFYPNVVSCEDLESELSFSEKKRTRALLGANDYEKLILVGNSGFETNNHLEIIHYFANRANFPFKLIVPLSYGNPKYIAHLVEECNRLLGDRFVPLLKFLDPDKYVAILKAADIGVFNSYRSQGVGNIVALLFLGKHVLLNKRATIAAFMQQHGIYTSSVEYLDIINTDLPEDLKHRNREIIRSVFSVDRAKQAIEDALYL